MVQCRAIGDGPHLDFAVETHVVRVRDGVEALGRRSQQLADLEALQMQATGLDLGVCLLEQLVDLENQGLRIDVDRDDGLVPLVVGELIPASLQGMGGTDDFLQRPLQLTFDLRKEQCSVAEPLLGGIGAQLGRRRLLPRDMVGDETGVTPRRRTISRAVGSRRTLNPCPTRQGSSASCIAKTTARADSCLVSRSSPKLAST